MVKIKLSVSKTKSGAIVRTVDSHGLLELFRFLCSDTFGIKFICTSAAFIISRWTNDADAEKLLDYFRGIIRNFTCQEGTVSGDALSDVIIEVTRTPDGGLHFKMQASMMIHLFDFLVEGPAVVRIVCYLAALCTTRSITREAAMLDRVATFVISCIQDDSLGEVNIESCFNSLMNNKSFTNNS